MIDAKILTVSINTNFTMNKVSILTFLNITVSIFKNGKLGKSTIDNGKRGAE